MVSGEIKRMHKPFSIKQIKLKIKIISFIYLFAYEIVTFIP